MTSLAQYVGRMKEGQKGIYYMVRARPVAGPGRGPLSAFCFATPCSSLWGGKEVCGV
jgi:hypothetical protein